MQNIFGTGQEDDSSSSGPDDDVPAGTQVQDAPNTTIMSLTNPNAIVTNTKEGIIFGGLPTSR